MNDCTGVAARWCPIHGHCTDKGTKRDGHCDDRACPLHGDKSKHAAVVDERIQRERDAAVRAEWAQIDRIGRVVAKCLEGTAAEMREIAKTMVYDRTSALARLEAMTGVIDEAAMQLRTWRLPPDANADRKAKDAAEPART